MPNDYISRTGASALIPEDAVSEIIKSTTEQSAFLSLATRIRNMRSNEMRLPILTELPEAYFVSEGPGDDGLGGLKKTTQVKWNNKYVRAEELAVIVPIHENVLEDSEFDIWGEVSPLIAEAMGRKIDRAVLFGEDAPADWPDDILAAATAAGMTVIDGSGVDLYEDLLEEDGLIGMLENVGYLPNGYLAQMRMRSRLRGVRNTQGDPIFNYNTMQAMTPYTLEGDQVIFPRNGSLIASDTPLMFAADWTEFVYSLRTDMRIKIADEAVITDSSGNIIRNLFQQDMIAMRVTWRLGWQVANPVSPLKPDTTVQASATPYVGNPERYPASVLLRADYS